MRLMTISLLAMCSVAALRGQSAPGFDAVSIKQNKTGQGTGGGLAGSRYTANNQTVVGIVMGAYHVTPERIIGGPSWIANDRFDVVAASSTPINAKDLDVMLQSLLRDRFGFAGHRETRTMAAYRLVPRTSGELGPGLKRAAVDCGDPAAVAAARSRAKSSEPVCGGRSGAGQLIFRGTTVNALAAALTSATGRQVVNDTGLTGRFDIDLEWSSLQTADGLSIFTAVQEQLGLKLESSTAAVEVVVIDSVSRPAEN